MWRSGLQEPDEPGGPAQAQHQDPGGGWVERPGVAHASLATGTTDGLDDVVGGRPGGLVDHQDPFEIGSAPACHDAHS
jgi:hypothetical protein